MPGWLARLLRRGTANPSPIWIEPDELRLQLVGAAPPLVVDVRGPEEFDGPLGHIESARNIPLPQFARYRDELAAAGRPLVMVCLTDMRSSRAAAELAAIGVRDVTVLRGGMKAWRGHL